MSTAPVTHAGALTDAGMQAIHDLIQRAHNAQSDADALAALHTDGAVIVNIAGRRVLGAQALADAMHIALRSPLRDVRTTVDIIDVRPLTADAAVVSCEKTVHDERADAAGDRQLPARGALTYVVVKSQGAWRIALAQTTPIAT